MLLFFDMDATLVTIEGSDILAKKHHVESKIQEITQRTMNGEMDFTKGFFEKIELLQPSKQELVELSNLYPHFITPGITDLIHTCQQHYKVGIITHGFRITTQQLLHHMHIDPADVYAIDLDFTPDGKFKQLTPQQILLEQEGKGLLMQELKKQHPTEKIIMVGDGHNDFKTQGIADLFIGFGVNVIRPQIQQHAQEYVTTIKELEKLLITNTKT